MASTWDTFRKSDFVVIFLTSLWLCVVLQYYLPMLMLLPLALIPGVGTHWYRRITGVYDAEWGRFSCLAIPMSWCNTNIVMTDYDFLMKFKANKNSLLLSNHCSRIDWLLAVYVGMAGDEQSRVGFVAEVTTALMPVIGWSRYLLGDILLQRAFHKDRPRIIANIKGFHESGVRRLLFLAPEGTIADPGLDDEYIANCGEFMKKEGKEPLTHLLTPRYKGMSAFVLHAPGNVASSAMTFVQGKQTINPSTGAIEGGTLYTTALDSPDRVIPDLHSIFAGDLSAYVHLHPLALECRKDGSELSAEGAIKLRTQLIDEQEKKDAWLRDFEKNRKYSDAVSKGDDWTVFPCLHFRMNGTLVAHTMFTVAVNAWFFGTSHLAMVKLYMYFVLGVFALHGSSHKIGQWSSDGRSRESLVGETAIKAFLSIVFKRSMNQGGKPKEEEPKKTK
mmetsp:Transcript_7710/g.14545  ORF Transcript_7710/g.14545 Transcript_7710/m.14545 type:complete len:446 (-) Transcript_7710:205-1542(-)